jgi:hypothetical protein
MDVFSRTVLNEILKHANDLKKNNGWGENQKA